jgi:hypothetical protein
VSVRDRTAKGRDVAVEHTEGRSVLRVAVMKQTHVDIDLRDPTVVELPRVETEPLCAIRIAADEPPHWWPPSAPT